MIDCFTLSRLCLCCFRCFEFLKMIPAQSIIVKLGTQPRSCFLGARGRRRRGGAAAAREGDETTAVAEVSLSRHIHTMLLSQCNR